MLALSAAFLALLSVSTVLAQNECNPLTTATCPPIPGLSTSTYTVDFTQQTKLPDGWILANYANVTFGPEGAKFWFNKRGQAPYIWTNFYIAYGRVDVDIMVSNGTGIITSSVLFSDDQDEIDWEFSGSNFATSSGKAFTNYFGKGLTGNYDRASLQDVSTPQKMFHTYSFDWTPQNLRWIIDGTEKHAQANTGQTTGNYQYPQTPARLHLGLWDAGDPSTAAGTVNWAGGYTNYADTPYYAIVRSVKITTPYPCSSWQYPTNFSGKWTDVKCTNQTISSASTSISSTSTGSATTTSPNALCTANTLSVAGGDSGWSIANRFGISFDALNTANAGLNWDQLNPGQILNIPCNFTTTSGSLTSTSIMNAFSSLTNGSTVSGGGLAATTLTSMSSSSVSSSSVFSSTISSTNFVFPTLSATNSSTLTSTQALTSVVSPPLLPNTTSAANGSAIANSNPISNNDANLYAKCTSDPYTYYVVAGDWGSRISDKLGIRFDYIYQANPNVDWNNLKVGQALQIQCGHSTITSVVSISAPTSVLSTGSPSSPGSTLTNSTISSTMLIVGPPLLNTPTSNSASPSQSVSILAGVSTSLPPGWKYKACFTDNLNPRSLNVSSGISTSQMNNSRCVTYCDSKGYVLAGTEWSGECYCGMDISNAKPANEAECNMKCYATTTEMCGGDARLSLYHKDTNSSANIMASSASSSVLVHSNSSGSSFPSFRTPVTVTSLSSSPVPTTGVSSTAAAAPSTVTPPTSSISMSASSTCTSDQCFSNMTAMSTAASSFCSTFMNPARTIASDVYANVFAHGCTNAAVRISSACNCLMATISSATQSLSLHPPLPTSLGTLKSRQHVRGRPSWNRRRRRTSEIQYDGRESGGGNVEYDSSGMDRDRGRGSVRAGGRAEYGG